LIILRDPVDRFISAVNHVVKSLHLIYESTHYHGEVNYIPAFVSKNKARLFKAVFERGGRTPNDWAEILKNKAHDCNEALNHIISNNEPPFLYDGKFVTSSKIGPQQCKYIYPFEPQSSWYHGPRFVILMDNFQTEVSFLLKSLGVNVDIPHVNKTLSPVSSKVSNENSDWIKEKYAKDFELYDNYSRISYKERIANKL
jgi:hypothetical protein